MGNSTAIRSLPNRILVAGASGEDVRAVQRRLNAVGCGPVVEDAFFGPETQEAVELFQMRSFDSAGSPLFVDGRAGPLTLAALFGEPLPTRSTAFSTLLATTLHVATGEIGVLETPAGSNRGPRVDQYLRSVGLDPASGSYPWCAAFVYWCFGEATRRLNVANPVVRTAGVLDHWNKAGARGVRRLAVAECIDNPELVTPGMIFILSAGGGQGHTGLVEKIYGLYLITIEGNTNEGGSREGTGVFRRTTRKIPHINRGFIEYGA